MATLEEALAGLNYTGADTGYGVAAQTLNQMTPQLINPYGSTGQAVGIGLGSILLQSLLGYQARQQASQDTLELNSLANQLMTKATPEARTEFIGGVSDPMYQGRLSTLSTALMQQEATRKAKAADKLLDLETAANFELGPLGTQLANRKQGQEVELARARIKGLTSALGNETAGTVSALPSLESGTLLQTKQDALIARGIQMGMTPNQAAQYAEKNLRVDRKATDTAQKNIEKSRARGIGIEELASKARAGIEGAGMTGGLLAAPRELASKAYAMISPKEQLQRDSQAVLNSIKPDLVAIGRSPGNVTDKETEMLIGAGPSILNTPSENIKLVKGMEQLAQLEQDYADFLEDYVQSKGSSIGADALWRQYKSEQVFPAGVYNSQRQDWNSWMAENAGMVSKSAITEPNVANSNSIAALQARLDALDIKEAELKARKGIK